MQLKELIEDLVVREVKGLCTTCVHTHDCLFHKTATKKIIQCELFELGFEPPAAEVSATGLCKTCDNAAHCKLSGRKEGVWRCSEFI